LTTATNKPASGNNANGVILLQQIMVRSMVKIVFVDNDDLYIED
jgi:hypothetical protein